jgi:hypothetical protein
MLPVNCVTVTHRKPMNILHNLFVTICAILFTCTVLLELLFCLSFCVFVVLCVYFCITMCCAATSVY